MRGYRQAAIAIDRLLEPLERGVMLPSGQIEHIGMRRNISDHRPLGRSWREYPDRLPAVQLIGLLIVVSSQPARIDR